MPAAPPSRGKGKVVHRQATLNRSSDAVKRYLAADAVEEALCARITSNRITAIPSQGSSQSTAVVIHVSSSSESTSTAVLQPSQAAEQSSIVNSTRGNATQHQWRCAPFLEGGSPAELQAKHLGTQRSRQLLRQHQPLLIRGQNLASCRLSNPVSGSDSPSAAGTTHSAAVTAAEGSTNQLEQQQQHSPQQHSRQQQQITVLCSPAEANHFMQADSSKNLPGSYYHIRKPETAQLQMTFHEWCDSWQTWNSSRILLQVLLCNWELKVGPGGARVWPNTAVWPHLSRLLDMAATLSTQSAARDPTSAAKSAAAAAAGSSRSPIDWAQLRQLITDGQYSTSGQLHLIAGGRDALLPAKYDTSDRLICQVAGRQKLLLLPPGQGFKGLYPYPVAHPYDCYSCVDWEDPELEHWPAAALVKGLVCELSPGDTLLVPAYWFVHQQLQQPACVALVLQLQPLPTKLLSRDALLMQLSRMIEWWVAAEMGTANVRKWLLALAEGREWQQLTNELATVQGYKRIKICRMILKQLQQVLGLQPSAATRHAAAAEDHEQHSKGTTNNMQAAGQPVYSSALEDKARRFLAAMCDERLIPTDWLNEGIIDPLYLKYQPKHYLIREDAQAAKYPTLFRHKLIEHRDDWTEHAERLHLTSRHTTKRLMG